METRVDRLSKTSTRSKKYWNLEKLDVSQSFFDPLKSGPGKFSLENPYWSFVNDLRDSWSVLQRTSKDFTKESTTGGGSRKCCSSQTLRGPFSKPIGPIGTFYGTLFIVCEPPETMGTFVARLGTRRAAQKPKRTFRDTFSTDRAILFQNILRLSYIYI